MNVETACTIPEIADFDISRGHIMQVADPSDSSDIWTRSAGERGGIRVTREPDQINVDTVVRKIEEQLGVLGGAKVVAASMRQTAFLATLDRYVLANPVKPRALPHLLALGEMNAGNAKVLAPSNMR
ncbi:MAG: hypothetical protein J2P48_02235 [Alphaproteobacteria bacterium]|nr:hypothetical protein [Alphaproteobacteria bacterium]